MSFRQLLHICKLVASTQSNIIDHFSKKHGHSSATDFHEAFPPSHKTAWTSWCQRVAQTFYRCESCLCSQLFFKPNPVPIAQSETRRTFGLPDLMSMKHPVWEVGLSVTESNWFSIEGNWLESGIWSYIKSPVPDFLTSVEIKLFSASFSILNMQRLVKTLSM